MSSTQATSPTYFLPYYGNVRPFGDLLLSAFVSRIIFIFVLCSRMIHGAFSAGVTNKQRMLAKISKISCYLLHTPIYEHESMFSMKVTCLTSGGWLPTYIVTSSMHKRPDIIYVHIKYPYCLRYFDLYAYAVCMFTTEFYRQSHN